MELVDTNATKHLIRKMGWEEKGSTGGEGRRE